MTTAPQQAAPSPATAQAPSVPAASSAAHGKADSISPVNGKTSISPAVPALGGPTIVNGNNAVGQSAAHRDHSRKSSITISAAGTSGQMPNGGPVAGRPASGSAIQFGQLPANMAPNVASGSPNAGAGANLTVSTPTNPRVTSPQTSPSPIPQPPASGGRPPSSLHSQNNGLSFGSLGGEEVNRRGSMPQGSLTPNMQNAHLRRESTPTTHNEVNNGMMGQNGGRGGYPPQGGRGRGYSQQQYGQPMPYSPNPPFRAPNAPRQGQNMGSPYAQGRGIPPYGQSPHQGTRSSPSLSASQPIHPQAGQMPMPNSQVPQQPYYTPQMHQPGQYMNQPFDPNTAAYYYANPQPYGMQPGMPPMPPQYMTQSPRPHYASPAQGYMPAYGQQQPQPMSRTASGVSDRPPSTTGQHQPSISSASGHQSTASRGTNSPAPKPNFQIPQRKSAGIVIKDPNSGAVKTFEKPSASPAPSKSPSIAATATPPPPSKPAVQPEPAHTRTDSQSLKTNDEKKLEMAAAVRQKIEDDKRRELEQKSQVAGEEAKTEPTPAPKSVVASTAPVIADADDAEPSPKTVLPEKPVEKPATPEQPQSVPETKTTEPEKEVAPEDDEESDEYWARIEAEEAAKEAEREAAYQKRKAVADAEKAKRAAEEAARLDEELKRAEKEAEEVEAARNKKKAEGTASDDQSEGRSLFATLKKSENAFKATQTATEALPSEDTPAVSGTATPASEASSMGPPTTRGSIAKQKPAALKLETSKQVEPPQPSAALQSLRSARFLNAISNSTYPASIASPNPALNSAAPQGKFRYDKEFLLQFQRVFVEKPSETWTDKVKETVGDTSETPASARGGRGGRDMSARSGSNRASVLPGSGFGSGTFGQFGQNRTLPPGTTSAERFAASTSKQPIRYNSNTSVGGFGMNFPSVPMGRTGSSGPLGPQSPRNNPSRGGRGGSKGGKRDSDKDAKTMPLTAGMEIKTLKVSETGWKPPSVGQSNMAGPPPGGDAYMTPDIVQRKVKSNLNKMTPSTFEKISDQILAIVQQSQKETDGRTLRQVIGLTFEKATDEEHWAQMYANFCSKMLAFVQNLQPEIRDETLPLDKNGKVNGGGTLFRKYLLNRCQQDFEAGWQSKLPTKPDGEDQSKEAELLSDEYYTAAAAKRRGLGLVRFIGELYKQQMLTSRIMHMCVKKLVDFDGMPDEAEVESLASLLKTIGANLDSEEKARPSMDAYFSRINDMTNLEGLPSRMRFMLMDIIDLRKGGWKTKEAMKGPATIEEIHAQAAAADREREAQRAADNSRRGGGGRPGMGRGDARNFSNPMPPPQNNTVGMDDIRRLGRGGSRQASSHGPVSLGGPPSMFGARGSNPRRSMGPGLLGRGGEDSGSSSRTGTPPQREKDKKEEREAATSANTFSALLSLDSGEHNDHPGSPPSQANSPPVSKARPVAAETERSKSPLKSEERP